MSDSGERKFFIEECDDVSAQPHSEEFPSYKVIIEETEDTRPIAVPDQLPAEIVGSAPLRRTSDFSWRPVILIASGGIIILGSLLVEWLVDLIKLHRILAIPVGFGLAILFLGVMWLLIKEIYSVCQLVNAEKFRSEIARLSRANAPWSDAVEVVRLWKRDSDNLARLSAN